MELTQDDVIHILKMIDEAPVGRFSLQVGDLKLEVAKGDGPAVLPAIQPLSQPAGQPAAVVATVEKLPASAVAAPSVAVPAETGPAATAAAGVVVVIKAPILGIFYRCAQPGAPAYVENGSMVEEDTTVALIEVMKLFNPVKAGVRGRILRISAENGVLVEHGQELFQVAPA